MFGDRDDCGIMELELVDTIIASPNESPATYDTPSLGTAVGTLFAARNVKKLLLPSDVKITLKDVVVISEKVKFVACARGSVVRVLAEDDVHEPLR